MGNFIIRRLIQAVFTVLGVMFLTFLLFNVVAGDIASSHVSKKAGPEAREKFMVEKGLNNPKFINTSEAPYYWKKTQFFSHLSNCVTLNEKSWKYKTKTILSMISERGKYSLAITVPVMALGWMVGLSMAAIVAYCRGRWIDHTGVFLAVLGMCIPFLAYILFGQWLIFKLSPKHAFGLGNKINVYVPIFISLAAGLGTSVRFYRTIMLDQLNRDYVRTARAKGVSAPVILGKHVLKNCMLPILTSLIMSIPFLILGSFLLEQFFGIPGVGGLMINSIKDRDVPMITGLTFLLAVVYVIMLLITDILYAVFDPRIRLE